LSFEIVVNDVFNVDCVKIIGPRMQYLEAFVLDILLSVSLNVLPEELKGTLIGLDWIAEVILVHNLLVVT